MEIGYFLRQILPQPDQRKEVRRRREVGGGGGGWGVGSKVYNGGLRPV